MFSGHEGLDLGREIASAIVCLIGGALCSGSGIGGGGFYIPTFIFLLGLPPHLAIPLSKATIFGLSFTTFCFNLSKRHPDEGRVYSYDTKSFEPLDSLDSPESSEPPTSPDHSSPSLLTVSRPLIAYDVAQIMEPISLAGTVIGVLLNTVSPPLLTLAFLILLFSATAYKTLSKALATYHAETGHTCDQSPLCLTLRRWMPGATAPPAADEVEFQVLSDVNPDDDDDRAYAENDDDDNNNNDDVYHEDDHDHHPHSQQQQQHHHHSLQFHHSTSAASLANDAIAQQMFSAQALDVDFDAVSPYTIDEIDHLRAKFEAAAALLLPWPKVGLLLLVWAVSLAFAAVRFFASFIHCGDLSYWAFFSLQIAVLCAVSLLFCRAERAEHDAKTAVGFPSLQGDVKWSRKNTLRTTAWSFFAGIIAAYLGVGGGLVKAPVMLELGMLPTVVAATSTFMIMFTSSSSSLMYLFAGSISWARFVLYFIIGGFGAMAGQLALSAVLKRYKKQYIVAFLLGTLVAVSGVTFFAMGIREVVVSTTAYLFRPLCEQSSSIHPNITSNFTL